jgi:hypothetical protein
MWQLRRNQPSNLLMRIDVLGDLPTNDAMGCDPVRVAGSGKA